MRESRWRSMSIMDLNLTKRRSGGAGITATESGGKAGKPVNLGSVSTAVPLSSHTGGQSYELIKSTQSLVDRLHLNAEDITIQPVHPSIIGTDSWFQITYTSSGTTRYFSCQNTKERDEWILSLKKTLMLTEDRRRTDNSLKIGVVEVKGLRDKKKYFVEILVDDKLYAKTSSKKMSGMCFWGESFEFKDLPNVDKVSLLIHKDKSNGHAGAAGQKKKPKKPVGRVKISIPSIQSRYTQEKWHPVEKSSRRESPSIRLKCQFQSVDILPLRDYEDFLYFLKDEYKAIAKLFEPNISVKVKEELSHSLMSVFHAEDMAEDVLADIVVDEISSIENEHLTFRGNSIATKAMEAYIKLVGQRYLQSTLQSVITEIILSDLDLEIDPVKVSSPEALLAHRGNLRTVVKQVWSRIAKSYSYFPIQLQRCFYKIRQYLEHVGKPEVGENLISSCIFLRYLCPAILSPSLFNLTDEYPSERANRNLTLVAKTLQTLANFTSYQGKENSMEFLNSFLEEERVSMKTFLLQISSPLAEDGWIPALSTPTEKTDLGRHLSCLHTTLFENVSKVPADNLMAQRLRELLDDINDIFHRPTIPELEQISRSTMATLNLRKTADTADGSSARMHVPPAAAPTKQGFWTSWTLPKKSKSANINSSLASGMDRSANYSVPAPHHAKPNFFAKPEPGISHSSDSTSSSASLTPSPGVTLKSNRLWGSSGKSSGSSSSSSNIIIGGGTRSKLHVTDLTPSRRPHHHHTRSKTNFPSSMSLDDTDSSDDSTYSSQYQSDSTSTPRCNSHTLPRPLTGGTAGYSAHSRHKQVHRGTIGSAVASGVSKTQLNSKSLSDYEQEIMDLRLAMETLQIKLDDAQTKLYHQERHLASTSHLHTLVDNSEESVREVVNRLVSEEDQLRRFQLDMTSGDDLSDKELMILMQQKKIAALDAANGKLVSELNRLGDKLATAHTSPTRPVKPSRSASEVVVVTSPSLVMPDQSDSDATAMRAPSVGQNVNQDPPKTVDELLDSLHSTPI